ncbi:hypothetical protein [Sphingomonas rubra]|uniref:Glycosyltransferase RgtA/B/C/D-like domain-containing protein n=1 Tax=Sphingomonas rubra TaxID=634430 RepID=A0A1I5U630_9SPHN|nr:hypothetical protein [Sphingomonas rubra]SFP90748.1 hypothetical protein SAMN04488241_110152 [Sphingomonas rubra]
METEAVRPDRGVRAMLFLLVWLSVAWFGSWELNPNNAVRMFAAVSLVEQGDATIDEFAGLTIDKATFGAHTYSDKAPGMTLLAVPAVALATWATGTTSADHGLSPYDPGFARFLRLRQRMAVALGPALLAGLAAVLLYDIGLASTGVRGAALFGAVGTMLGTPLWGWSTTVTGHAAVAALYLVAIRNFLSPPGTRAALLGGVALGLAAVVEYQAVIAGSVIAGWAAWRWRDTAEGRRAIALAAAAGLAGLMPLLSYNLLAFGTPFRIGYSGVEGFDGMKQGLFGLGWPRIAVLVEILVGDRRGLFWVAPVLLVAPLGLASLGDRPRTRSLAVMAALAAAAVLLVNAAYVYWDGGNSTGPRHAMPAAALLGIGLAPWWAGLRTAWERWGVAALLALSVAINAAIAAADVFAPPEYRYPFWRYVMKQWFLRGDLRTWPSEWLGWTAWHGFALYLAVAVPLGMWLVRRVARY